MFAEGAEEGGDKLPGSRYHSRCQRRLEHARPCTPTAQAVSVARGCQPPARPPLHAHTAERFGSEG
eukprot:169223-Rhodomonas_salina.1